MPRKTIYISKEDEAVFQEYADKMGGDEGVGKLVVDVMKEQLQGYAKLEEKAFQLAMIIMSTEVSSFVRDLAQYRFDSLPHSAKVDAFGKAACAMITDPTFFSLRIGEERRSIVDVLLFDDCTWFEEGEKLALSGKDTAVARLQSMMGRLGALSPEQRARPAGTSSPGS